MKPSKQESNFQSLILWELKLRGDVHQNHMGGNALQELRKRLRANSPVPISDTQISNLTRTFANLKKTGKITAVSKGKRSKIIRLRPGISDAELGVNPFPSDNVLAAAAKLEEKKPSLDVARNTADVVTDFAPLLEPYRDWPGEKRIELATALMASVYRDITRVKNIL